MKMDLKLRIIGTKELAQGVICLRNFAIAFTVLLPASSFFCVLL